MTQQHNEKSNEPKVEISYAPSTEDYLEDRREGKPWITKLPFPVHVLRKVTTNDLISGSKLTTSYRYHHGYFDGPEREFRGFGMVETLDTETFEEWKAGDDDPETEPQNYVAPILTKTWFHNGAFTAQKGISAQYKDEYFKGANKESPDSLDDSIIEEHAELFSSELREAYRALKGKALRQEVYEYGDEDRCKNPYTVTESSFFVRTEQRRGKQKHGVFVVHPRETLTWHFEQDPSDPRIGHEAVLKVDDYGNVEESCSLVYPRGFRHDASANHPKEQKKVYCTYNEAEFINHTQNHYLLGVAEQTRSFEIGGLKGQLTGPDFFAYEELKKHIDEALKVELPFETPVNEKGLSSRLLSHQRNRFWNSAGDAPLTVDVEENIPPQALLHHVETAILSKGLTTEAFEGKVTDNDLIEAKYKNGGDGYWWNPGLVQHYEDADHFYLPVRTEDPFGNSVSVEYDVYDLAVIKTIDALKNESTAEVDYRTLSPKKLTGPNGTCTEAITDPLGLVIATSVYGTEPNAQGVDDPRGDLPLEDYQVQEVPNLRHVIDNPHVYLQNATTFFFYDVEAWKDREEPPQAVGLAREQHVLDPGGEQSPVQVSVTYSDGFGREIQSKLLVEPGDAWKKQQDGRFAEESVPERWLVSGRTVFNNKQKPIKKYEPFYSASHAYEPEEFFATYGVTPVIHYDPLLRVVKTDTPKGFFSKVEFTPWQVKTFDENDTVLESEYYNKYGTLSAEEQTALDKAANHADTPSVADLDTLGRQYRVTQKLREGDEVRDLVTYTEFDITGKPLTVTDPRQHRLNEKREENIRTFRYTYDMAGETLRTVSIDAGDDQVLANVMGNPVLSFDKRGHRIKAEYDTLHRLEKKTVSGGSLGREHVVEVLEYGESIQDVELAKSQNKRTRLIRHWDSSGLAEVDAYDFKGQPQVVKKRIRTDYKNETDWSGNDELEPEVFTTENKYDALGRIVWRKNPDDSVERPEFHQSGLLDKVSVTLKGKTDETPFVTGISYNPKGQRERITYGNGTKTVYVYEPETFRLTSLQTTRQSDGKAFQDITYVYDPVGNIVQIRDDSHNRVFTAGGPVEPKCEFVYDALYRLKQATGRTHNALAEGTYKDPAAFKQSKWTTLNDMGQLSEYTRKYTYDDSGNLHEIKHLGVNNFTRKLDVDETSNRALLHEDGFTPDYAESFDANGNQVKMDHLGTIAWNFRDNIASVTMIDRGDNGPNNAEYYVYDASGQRVRKVTERLASGIVEVEEKIYLGGVEIKRFHKLEDSSLTTRLERYDLHVMDDKQRIAVVNHWTKDDLGREVEKQELIGTNRIRYQYGNHLGSASLELAGDGRFISYEEYFPYGGTAFITGQSQTEVKLKEYRYTGKERDDTTGFYYHGARYYAPWLGRWLSPDPAGPVDGSNLYQYVNANPQRFDDPEGMNGDEVQNKTTVEPKIEIKDPELIKIIHALEKMESGGGKTGPVPAKLRNASGVPATWGVSQVGADAAITTLRGGGMDIAKVYGLTKSDLGELAIIARKTAKHYDSIADISIDADASNEDIEKAVSSYLKSDGKNFIEDTGLTQRDAENMLRASLFGKQIKKYKNDDIDTFMGRESVSNNINELQLRKTDVNAYRDRPRGREHRVGFITKAIFNAPNGEVVKDVMTRESGRLMGMLMIRRTYSLVSKAEAAALATGGISKSLSAKETAQIVAAGHNLGITKGKAKKWVRNPTAVRNNPYVRKFMTFYNK